MEIQRCGNIVPLGVSHFNAVPIQVNGFVNMDDDINKHMVKDSHKSLTDKHTVTVTGTSKIFLVNAFK